MRRLAIAAAAGLTVAAFTGAVQTSHYHVIKTIPMGTSRADYIIIDQGARRLYGMGDAVIDVDKDTVIGHVKGGGGGYAIAPDLHRGLVRNGVVFDLGSMAVTGQEDVKGDGIRYDKFTRRAFVWEGKDGWVVDMKSGKLEKKMMIGDGLETGVVDGRGKMFANVEDKGAIERFDTKALTIDTVYAPVPGCGRAQGLAMDTANRRLFMACDTNMVVVNADNGNIVTRIRVASRADQNCYDASTHLVFNPNRVDSTMSVIHEDSPDMYTVTETVKTGGGARTCAVDEKTHKVYIFYYQGTDRATAQMFVAVLAP
jgi:hypothetical protein